MPRRRPIDKSVVAVSAPRRLKIRRRRYAESGPGILEVTHHHYSMRPTAPLDGTDRERGLGLRPEESWVFVIRDRNGKSKGGFVLYQAEAILLVNILTETAQESIDTWDVPS
jgi:hypothetical protein